jgi:formamidopyrimidine-DNA glycosylase
MPELPEAEIARRTIERVLGRKIVAVDDHDRYVSRPHAAGELADALTGHKLTSAHRRGKFIWVETDDGPDLGLHLGMTGSIVVDGEPKPWDRFALEFAGGGRLALRDMRRFGRAVLAPDFSHVGPDAAEVGRDEFRGRVGRGKMAIKARLLDQKSIAGVGNLMADEALWRARIAPHRPAGELSTEELDALRRAIRAVAREAIRRGGLGGAQFVAHRERGGHCPRDGTELRHGRYGGRSTYWCPRCQK